jgi:hypothetical protein
LIAHWLTAYEVYDAIYDPNTGKQVHHYPDYNFAMLDSCNNGETPEMCVLGFNIPHPNQNDRAFLGWDVLLAANLHNVNWTNRLFQALSDGKQLWRAVRWANENGGPAQDKFDNDVQPVRYGDLLYKMHGVYGLEDTTQWCR